MTENSQLDQLTAEVQKKPKYADISIEIIQRIGDQELKKRSSLKEAVKGTLSKLHQIGGAYLEHRPDFSAWLAELEGISDELKSEAVKDFCQEKMKGHASTLERLPFLKEFYQVCLKSIAPVHSILDLGCGINPLALPWMPLAVDPMYLGLDIINDLTQFDQRFLEHVHMRGRVLCKDFLNQLPRQRYQLALVLKVIPLIEQISKTAARPWLESIPAENLLVSFPKYSLSGKGKGMRENYAERFIQLTQGSNWKIEPFEFTTELAFLLSR
jgi:16S rRNA (guanine(1405)-N(7))-methyltransferase